MASLLTFGGLGYMAFELVDDGAVMDNCLPCGIWIGSCMAVGTVLVMIEGAGNPSSDS